MAGINVTVRDNKVADFTVVNYAALKLKYPQRETCSVPDPTDRLFFNGGVFRPQGSHDLPQQLYYRFRWHFAPSFGGFDCQVKRAN